MHVNVYNEEMTDRVEKRDKAAEGVEYTGIEFFVGPPMNHMPGDDDTSRVTF